MAKKTAPLKYPADAALPDPLWPRYALWDQLIMDNAHAELNPSVKSAIEAYMAALRKCPQVADKQE